MRTPEASPARQSYEDRSKSKCYTQSVSDYKRDLPSSQQSQKYNMIRKYHQSTMSQIDPDSTVKSVKDSEKQQKQDIVEQKQFYKPDLSVIQQQRSLASSSMPMRQRYSNLLLPYMSYQLTIDELKLVQMQTRLDQLLDYLRLQRNKVKGQYLSAIKNNFRQNTQTAFEFSHLKQILFLKPDFYQCNQKKDEGKIDLLIALPDGAQLAARKIQFRKTLVQYLQKNQKPNTKKREKIPQFVFPFCIKQEQQKKKKTIIEIKNSKNFWASRSKPSGINPFDALIPGNSTCFQQQLLLKIKQRQQKIKQQKQNMQPMKFGRNQLLAVYDELPKIFKSKQKSSMFKSTIIQDLDRLLNIKQGLILNILDILLEKYANYFKVIEHKCGDIIQIQRKIYNQIRLQIEKQPLEYPNSINQSKQVIQNNDYKNISTKQAMIRSFSQPLIRQQNKQKSKSKNRTKKTKK